MMKNIKSRKSQLTIFVIIGLIIVIAVASVIMLLREKETAKTISAEENIQAYIQSCVKTNLENIEKKLIDSNFYPKLDSNYLVYMNEKVPYLCRASQFYLPCVNQEPNLAGYLRKEIEKNLGVEKCFSSLVNELRLRDYVVSEGSLKISTELANNKIIIILNKDISVKKNDETKTYNKFVSSIQSSLYNFAKTAEMIGNYESEFCEFNSQGWMAEYPDIAIKVFKTSDGSKVYTLTDDKTEKQIKFAVKSCVLPAGI